MPLTNTSIVRAQPKSRSYRLADGEGLSIEVKVNGKKYWRLRYFYLGKENMLSLGGYPEVGLADAREKKRQAKILLGKNIDPSAKRKQDKVKAKFSAENSFEIVAKEWHDNNLNKWSSAHARKLWRRLELHIFPKLGSNAIKDITTLELLAVLKEVEKQNKTETSKRLLQVARSVFQYAVLTQRIEYNPANDLQGVLKSHKVASYPSIKPEEIADFMQELEDVKTSELNRLAMKFLSLTMVRQGEMRQAKWEDIDFKKKEWKLPPETTKMKTLHHVPLSKQAIKILKEIHNITGSTQYVFASQHSRKNPYMSENTLNKTIHDMGYKGKMVAHGFRSLASTILNEEGL